MSDIGRKLKFLRDRDQVTVTRLAQAVGLEKEYLREVEAGRQELNDQAVWLVSDFFKVKPDYFKGGDDEKPEPATPATPARKGGAGAPPVAASSRRGGKPGAGMDFGDFAFFKPEDAKKDAGAKRGKEFEGYAGEESQVILKDGGPSDLADVAPGAAHADDPEVVEMPSRPAEPRPKKGASARNAPAAPPAAPARAPAAPAAARAPAPAPAPAAAPAAALPPVLGRPPGDPNAIAQASGTELLRALIEVLSKKGFFSREEFEAALRKVKAD